MNTFIYVSHNTSKFAWVASNSEDLQNQALKWWVDSLAKVYALSKW